MNLAYVCDYNSRVTFRREHFMAFLSFIPSLFFFCHAPQDFDGVILMSWLGVSIHQSLHKEASLIKAL